MARSLTILLACLVVAGTFAGCSAAKKDDCTKDNTCSTPPVKPVVDKDKGAIEGFLIDQEGQIISGAQVGIVGPETRDGTTDANGHFVFSLLLPGDYNVLVSRIGFAHRIIPALVAAGETNDLGDIILIASVPEGVAHQVIVGPIAGKFFCGFYSPAVSGPCKPVYWDDGHPVEDGWQGMAHEKNIFEYPTAIDDNKSVESDQLMRVLVEMTWTPSSTAANELIASVEKHMPGRDPFAPEFETWGYVAAPSPLRLQVTPGDEANPGASHTMPEDASGFTIGVFPAADTTSPPVQGEYVKPSVYTEQNFQFFITYFYNEVGDLEFSALPDA